MTNIMDGVCGNVGAQITVADAVSAEGPVCTQKKKETEEKNRKSEK